MSSRAWRSSLLRSVPVIRQIPRRKGPLSSRRAADRLAGQVADAVAKGARVVTGGGCIEGAGAFCQPTVLTDVTPDMLAYHEELFGPVAVVYRVKDDDEAIARANSSPYGLGGHVYCSDQERARAVADRLETGMIAVNRGMESNGELPFGGVKRPGTVASCLGWGRWSSSTAGSC
jgi:succinate-semialdehyde dehydrogenase / glutarate-semialdehyde dehydrogenase